MRSRRLLAIALALVGGLLAAACEPNPAPPPPDPSEGTRVWTKQYWDNQTNLAGGLAVAPNGTSYVAGFRSLGSTSEVTIEKVRRSGGRQWIRTFSRPDGSLLPQGLALSRNGSELYLTGEFVRDDNPGTPGVNEYLRAGFLFWLSATTGNLVQQAFFAQYDTPGTGQPNVGDVAVDSAGKVYVVGSVWGVGFERAQIWSWGPTLLPRWVVNPYEDRPDEDAHLEDVTVDAHDNVYVAGTNTELTDDVLVARFTTDGARVWRSRFLHGGIDRAYGVVAHGKRVYVTGYTTSDWTQPVVLPNERSFLARLDRSFGALVWQRQRGHDGSDERGQDVTVDSLGRPYVVGEVGFGVDTDTFVVGYGRDGSTRWTKRPRANGVYDSPWRVGIDGNDELRVLGIVNGAMPGGSWLGGTDLYLLRYR